MDPLILRMGVLSPVLLLMLFILGISTVTTLCRSGDGFASDCRLLLVLGASLLLSRSCLLLDVIEDFRRSLGDFSTMISDLVDIRPTDILLVTISFSLRTLTGSDDSSLTPLPSSYRRGCLFPIPAEP